MADPFDETSVRDRLVAFLGQQTGAETAVEGLRRYAAGFSWLTYGFDASWGDATGVQQRSLVLRLGPPRGLFAPYRAWPQFAALRALEASAVPVPRAYWYSDEPAAFGAPFFICERVRGEPPLPWAGPGGQPWRADVRAGLAEQFMAALAALHRFEWRETAVAALDERVPEPEVARAQVNAWERALRRWARRRYPIVEWALGWLKARCPPAPRISLVHGDFRIGNFLESHGRITAILDWELVHLGDPHEDLGWMCLRAFRGRSPLMCHLVGREDLYRRYQVLSGMPVCPRSVHFYEVFGTFKLIAIHVGAARCFEDGGFDDLRMPAMGAQIPRLLEAIVEAIEAEP